jgi:nitric oxide reductase NorQ protein
MRTPHLTAVPTGPVAVPPAYLAQGDECALFVQAYQAGLPLLLKGPTGCGKTRLVEHMAAGLGRPLITVSGHDDLGAADLTGRHLIEGGDTRWVDGPLTRAVRQGAIFYLDEVVEARKDITVVLHPLADDRRQLPLDRTGEQLVAAPGFMLVLSYNPGYQHLLKGLKPSTRQRFVALTLGYPTPELEAQIVQSESGCSPEVARQLVRLAQALRRLTEHDLEETASTRLLVMAARLTQVGVPLARAAHVAVAEALTDDAPTLAALAEVLRAVLGD